MRVGAVSLSLERIVGWSDILGICAGTAGVVFVVAERWPSAAADGPLIVLVALGLAVPALTRRTRTTGARPLFVGDWEAMTTRSQP
jgi:hypothetical protein